MKEFILLLLVIVLFSCTQSDMEQFESGQSELSGSQNIVTAANGRQFPTLDPSKYYCGPGWGRKMCRFLGKYDNTFWADTENYYSDFSDIRFSNFMENVYFISFYNRDGSASYCEGWKLGETTNNGIKWNIKIKKDEEDALWFDYEYYGTSEEIEYTITYKYEVIDGLLNFSSSDGQTFIFNPSENNYLKDFVDSGEITVLEGCLFN